MTTETGAQRQHGSIDRRVAQLAASQHGVFSGLQVVEIGATRRMIERRLGARRWEAMTRGVYRLAGSPPSWRQALMIACLAWGRDAVVSHCAAAALWILAGFRPGHVVLTLPRIRRTGRRQGLAIVHQSSIPPSDVTTIDGIPVTTPARTLLDLASVVSREELEEAVDDALPRGLVSLPRLRWMLNRPDNKGRPGIARLRAVVEACEPGASVPQSVFERRLLRTICRGGLPEPIPQHEIRNRGRMVARVDYAYPETRLAIEADGYRWHSGRANWERDRARLNELTLLGWRIIHVTWSELIRNPDAVVARIRSALAGSPP